MPDFAKLFVVECDTSSSGFGAVLVQEGHPVAFFNRPVVPRHRKLAAYERELIGLVQAVRHWRPYLWGRHFIVKTDHFSLKYLLDQRLTTIPQHHWVGKLLGFDFEVEYRSGATNTVADALSRRDTEEGELLAVTAPRFDFIERLRQAQVIDPALVAIYNEIRAGTRKAPWSIVGGMVAMEGRLYIPADSPLLQEIVAAVHNDGHEGVHRTLHRLRRDFHFSAMRRIVQEFVQACSTCQRYKSDHLRPVGLLSLSRFPPACGQTSALTSSRRCLGWMAKRSSSPSSTASANTATSSRWRTPTWRNRWRKLSSRGGSPSWRAAVHRLGPRPGLHFVILERADDTHRLEAVHVLRLPPTDRGQSEAANRVIAMCLRCFTSDRPRQWLRWLPRAEYIYNTAYQSSLHATPFKVVYDRDPPSIRSYEPGETQVAAVAQEMEERAAFLDESAIGYNRPKSPRNVPTTSTIERWSTKWATGHSSVSVNGWQRRCHERLLES
jgi:hypothetical protein